jgi:hypothetical protein
LLINTNLISVERKTQLNVGQALLPTGRTGGPNL